MTLVLTYESKYKLNKYEEIWSKIKDLIRSTNNNSDDYDENYMKTKLNSEDNLPLKKTLKLHDIIILARSAFNDDSKCYPQVFLDASLYK